MNAAGRRTLDAIFQDPVRADIRWAAVASLMRALGARLDEGSGSRIRVSLAGVRAVFHRPHPGPHLQKTTVKSVRRFLTSAGVTEGTIDGDDDAVP
ncbi:MAG: type II toxin-antitoxin system HicA family toxin [Gemmatimonadaceae bacterium]